MENCEKIKNMLSPFIDRELSEKDANLVKEHINNCTDCKKEFNTLKLLRKEVADAVEVPLPENFKAVLHSKLLEVVAETEKTKAGKLAGFMAGNKEAIGNFVRNTHVNQWANVALAKVKNLNLDGVASQVQKNMGKFGDLLMSNWRSYSTVAACLVVAVFLGTTYFKQMNNAKDFINKDVAKTDIVKKSGPVDKVEEKPVEKGNVVPENTQENSGIEVENQTAEPTATPDATVKATTKPAEKNVAKQTEKPKVKNAENTPKPVATPNVTAQPAEASVNGGGGGEKQEIPQNDKVDKPVQYNATQGANAANGDQPVVRSVQPITKKTFKVRTVRGENLLSYIPKFAGRVTNVGGQSVIYVTDSEWASIQSSLIEHAEIGSGRSVEEDAKGSNTIKVILY